MELQSAFERLKIIVLEDLSGLESMAVAVFISLLIVILFYLLSRWVKKLVSHRLKRRLDDALLVEFIGASIKSVILIFGLLLVLRFLGLTGMVSGLLAGAGITAFIIGFALKDIGENFLAGILLAFKRPFKVGDIVEINSIRGRVLSLNLRDTHIKTGDGKDVFLPNASIIKNPLTNFTIDGYLSYSFTVGLSYQNDYQKALETIEETMNKVPGVLTIEKKPSVNVIELGSNGLILSISYWVNTYDPLLPDIKVKSHAILSVLQALESNKMPLQSNVVELMNHPDTVWLHQEKNKLN
jgi:small conductance mechanosensitive channel